MFAVVFEVRPDEGKTSRYLELVEHLKPMLEQTDGFVAVERFQSRRRTGWMLSLSVWRDEKAVVRWRSQGDHHAIQLEGRAYVFSDYHLRVGELTSDSQVTKLKQQRLDETEIGVAKALGITEIAHVDGMAVAGGPIDAVIDRLGLNVAHDALADHDVFESIYDPGKLLLLTSWKTAKDATSWTPRHVGDAMRHRTMRSVRDYALFDRREAPQFCPIVHRTKEQVADTG